MNILNHIEKFKDTKKLNLLLKQIKNKNSSFKFKRIFFYTTLIVVLCSIIIGIVSYQFILNNIKYQTIESNSVLLEQFKNTTDKYVFGTIDQTAISIYNGKNMQKNISYYLDNPIENNASNIIDIYDDLAFMKTSSSIIDSISVYYCKNNLIVSTEGMRYLSKYNEYDCIDTSWISYINAIKSNNSLWLSTRKVRNANDLERYSKNVITFIKKIGFGTSNYGGIAISIPEESLYQTIENNMPADFGNIFIINENGMIVSNSDKTMLYKNLNDIIDKRNSSYILSSNDDAGHIITKLGGNNVVVSYSTSKYNDWKYISIKPIKKFFAGYEFIINIIVYICISIILIWVILFLYSFNKFYKPLKLLAANSKEKMCIISNNNNPINTDEYNYNEYKIIDYTLSSLADKINELEDKIKQNFPVIKHYFILNIINNKFESIEDIQNKISLLKIDFPYSFFQAILIIADKNSNSLNCKIEDMFNEHLTGKCIYHLITIDNDTMIILINISDTHYNADVFPQDILQNIGYALCGSIYPDVGLLYKSYNEAKECEEYIMIDPDKKILTYDSILSYRKKELSWDINICRAFYDAVSSKDRERIINEFHNILISMKDSCLPHKKVIDYLDAFANHILDENKNIGIDYDNNRRNILFQKFNTIYSFYELENIFDDFINTLFDQIDQKKRNRNHEVVKNIKDYIDFNLLSVEMDLNSIASKFYMSPNYLSKVFKEETSSTLIDYIIDQKLDKARELLINTNLKIEEVSQTIGYSNCQYFIKIFKNKYGTTPKQYRISFFSK